MHKMERVLCIEDYFKFQLKMCNKHNGECEQCPLLVEIIEDEGCKITYCKYDFGDMYVYDIVSKMVEYEQEHLKEWVSGERIVKNE